MVLLAAGLAPGLWARESTQVRLLYSIPVPEEHQVVLEDVSAQGILLLNATGDMYSDLSDFRDPKLLLWDSGSRKMSAEITLPECIKRRATIGAVSQRGRLGPFRFVGDGRLIVGIQNPWLFLVDIRKKAEVSQHLVVLPSLFSDSEAGTRRPILAVSPHRHRIAVVLNNRSRPYLFVYPADLRGQVTSWQLETSVQSVCWSGDGKSLAVLYSGARNLRGNYISGGSKKLGSNILPNVEIFDARTGKNLLKFSTGDAAAEAQFGRDGAGTELYAIPPGTCAGCKNAKQDAILVFSVANGRLKRTFRVAGTGVRDSFELSPDGQLLAANASSAWMLFGFMAEASWTKSDGRFVLMNAHDGQVLFKHHERTWNRGAPFRFGFSFDGALLFADPNCNLVCPHGERVDVYSVVKSQ